MKIEERIQAMLTAKERWLFGNKPELNSAIHQTINVGFEQTDVFHALNWVQDNLTQDKLEQWVKLNQIPSTSNKNVLFFHAGNLPLVGFQDVIGAVLSGVNYFGKLSKKDPFLMSGFLNNLLEVAPSLSLQFSQNVEGFVDLKADALVFSGSEISSKQVLNLAKEKQMISDNAKTLIRTAHFSIAVLDEFAENEIYDVVESSLRYNGEGCRSTKIIMAPFNLHDFGCEITDVVESWWIKTKRGEQNLNSAQRYYQAYYKSVEVSMMNWQSHLVVETIPNRQIPGLIYWIKSDERILDEIKLKYGNQIQSIYSKQEEDLFKAQNPDLNWKPDGKDLLNFLSNL